ncbi:MAG: hypothetical protein V1844_03620 [Pseudomonadota bacterium]
MQKIQPIPCYIIHLGRCLCLVCCICRLLESPVFAETWICAEQGSAVINCYQNDTRNTYRFSFTRGLKGIGFSDHLNLNSEGIEISRVCQEFQLSFQERSCTVDVLSWGAYADCFRNVFGPKGHRLKIETRGNAMKVFALGDDPDSAPDTEPVFVYPAADQRHSVKRTGSIYVKVRRDFISHFLDSIDHAKYEPNLPRARLIERWIQAVYNEAGYKKWEMINAEVRKTEPDPNVMVWIQWIFALLGLCLNGLTTYLFYRGSRFRRQALWLSATLYGLSTVLFLTGLDPILLIGAFGFWSGLAFPFSLAAFPAQALINFLRALIEFEWLVFLLVMGPGTGLAFLGSFWMWTRLSPGIPRWRKDRRLKKLGTGQI